MDYEQLLTFVTIAETKSFTRTAELLHLTQSTVTTRIKNLEQSLGKPLLHRTNRRVELTVLGQTLLPLMRRSMELLEECKTLTQLESQYENRFVIGSVHSLWDDVLVEPFLDFCHDFPKTAFQLVTDHSIHIIESILDGKTDVGVVYSPPQHPDMQVVPLYQDQIQLLASPDWSGNIKKLTPLTLSKQPLIYLSWGEPFTHWFQQEMGTSYLPMIEVDHATLLINMLKEGKGFGFVLSSIAKKYVQTNELRVIPYQPDQPMPNHLVYLVFLKKNSENPILKAWINQMQKCVSHF